MLVLVLLLLRMLLVRGDRASDRFRGECLHAARTNLSTSRSLSNFSGNPSLPISLFGFKARDARTAFFFRAHRGRSRLPSRSLSLEKGDGWYRAVGVRAAPRVWDDDDDDDIQTGLKISLFLSFFSFSDLEP